MRTLMGDLGHYSPVMPKDRLRAYKKKEKEKHLIQTLLTSNVRFLHLKPWPCRICIDLVIARWISTPRPRFEIPP